MDIGTPLGLAFASGINAYLPLLAFAVSVRFLHLYKVNPNFAFVTSNWFMLALLLLTIAGLVVDKFPVIDHTWDAVHTMIRPVAGALVAAASYGQFHLPNINTGTAYGLMPQAMMAVAGSGQILGMVTPVANGLMIGGVGLIIMLIAGGLLALISHTAKATTRLATTVTTAGLLNVGVSIVEDVLVVLLVLLSILVPIVVLILIGLFLIVFGPRLFRIWGRRMRRDEGI